MNEFQSLLGELVEKVKPLIYVETGFMTGESAKCVLAAMHKTGIGTCHCIEPFSQPTFQDERLKFFRGYSYQKMEEVFNLTGPWDMFLHDSNHDVGCMTFELELAWRYIRPGGYIICDDYTWGTPEHKAWQKFTTKYRFSEVHQLGSCQYVIKPSNSKTPIGGKPWASIQRQEAERLSNEASIACGDKPIFMPKLGIKTFVLTLHETPEREASCRQHLMDNGIEAEFVYGFNAKTAGLATINNYEVDNPGGGHNIGFHGVGIWSSFIMMYQVANQMPDDHVFLLEHDVKFLPGWRDRFDQALRDVPPDFDFLFIGHCCFKDDRFAKHVKGDIFETKRIFCNHACIVARKCLPFVIKTLKQKCWAPVDIQLVNEVFPKLKVYAAVPRMAEQDGTVLRP
jgi:hypothetical protein